MPFKGINNFGDLQGFKQKVDVSIHRGRYTIKTAADAWELRESLELRHDVFYEEILGISTDHGLDVDQFDARCDHLLIKDDVSKKVVGSYRINCSSFSDEFYSSQEFDLTRILAVPGIKVELGRACIHPDFRTGAVISLLWRGVGQYMKAVNAALLFGCASIKTQDPHEAALLYRYFDLDGCLNPSLVSPPQPAFLLPGFDAELAKLNRELTPQEITHVEAAIPSLCKSYLKAGAYMGGPPALDREFKCIDFLTILLSEDMDPAIRKRIGTEK